MNPSNYPPGVTGSEPQIAGEDDLSRVCNERDRIMKDYMVDPKDNIIHVPGKFEGEARYVPYYWDIGLEGCADRDDGNTWGFNVSKEDKIAFPELKRRRTVKLIEDNLGFVREV